MSHSPGAAVTQEQRCPVTGLGRPQAAGRRRASTMAGPLNDGGRRLFWCWGRPGKRVVVRGGPRSRPRRGLVYSSGGLEAG